ncbi:ABC transporter substrate-binding protein [Halotalea alkalilenta]|uniref:ABC transporter substrate-binding protein n=1 Tax=Halotalea alkalilenta TaxID=376489 RepID=A0A172YCC7_9GAMM|nr:ABC transporter substrate-binding protein [Halotalea alkalilenta]ANF56877.1 ABC transporter substrate-binding protein [Halotalea alkalilenta]
MTDHKNSIPGLIGPEQSTRLFEAMHRGLSRRDALKALGAAGLFAASAGSMFGSGVGYAAEPAGTPTRGGRIRVAAHSASTSDTLDPALGATAIDYVRHATFYNGLTVFDETLTPQPALAEHFETTDGGTTWLFTLRSGVTFHDGKSLEPADVIFSLGRHKDPNTGSKVMSLAEQISTVEAVGDRQVRIVLSSPNVELPSILAVSHMMIVQAGTTDFTKGIGTGPFRCQEFNPGVRSVAVRNENYWKEGRPYLDEIEMVGIGDESSRVNALLSGDVQLVNNVSGRSASRVENSGAHAIKASNSGNYSDLVMRVDQEPTSRPEFVEAMKYLFDREQIKRAVFRNYAEIANDQPIAQSNRYYFDGLPQREYDPERARALLAKAGVQGARLPIVASPAANGSEDMAVLLQQSAQQAGLNLTVNRVPSDGYWSNHWMKHPLGFGNINPRPTANILLSQFFQSSAPWNESGWQNEQFDQLLVLSRQEPDEAKRMQMYADMQTLIHDHAGIGIPVFISDIDGYDTRLKGYERSIPLGGFMGYSFPEHVWWEA